jgi:hypothetical protein
MIESRRMWWTEHMARISELIINSNKTVSQNMKGRDICGRWFGVIYLARGEPPGYKTGWVAERLLASQGLCFNDVDGIYVVTTRRAKSAVRISEHQTRTGLEPCISEMSVLGHNARVTVVMLRIREVAGWNPAVEPDIVTDYSVSFLLAWYIKSIIDH